MSSLVSFQLSLFRNLVVGPLLIGGALLLVSLVTTQRLREEFAAETTGRIIAETEAAFVEYLRPVQEVVDLSLQMGGDGSFAVDSLEPMDGFFAALLETVHQLDAVHYAKESGEAYMLLRKAEGTYYNRTFDPADPGFIQTREWFGKPSPENGPVSKRLASDYDPRNRDWFTRAVAALREAEATPDGASASALVWSDPYPFFTTGEPGITASVAYRRGADEVEVLAFDILLSDILEFARSSQARHSGIVFILLRHPGRDDLKVLALPSEGLTGVTALAATEFPIPVDRLKGVPRQLIHVAFVDGVLSEGSALQFQAEGATWWGGAALSPLSKEREIWTVAALRQSQLLAGIPDPRVVVLVVLGLTVIVMLVWARWLARRYGDPVGELVAQTERMSRLNFSRENVIESPIHEIQALASSQDVMRRSLSALTAMNDREAIARQWRALPEAQAGPWRLGDWQAALWDAPAPGKGGCVSMAWPTVREGSVWRSGGGVAPHGLVMVSADLAVEGLMAAQRSASLRGAVGALLGQGVTLEAIALVLGEELDLTELLVASLDVEEGSLTLAGWGHWRLLHWCQKEAKPHWHFLGEDRTAPNPLSIPLGTGDRVLLTSEALFDVLNRQRQRFQRAQVESLLGEARNGEASELASAVSRRVRAFAEKEAFDEDLAAFVLSWNGGPAGI